MGLFLPPRRRVCTCRVLPNTSSRVHDGFRIRACRASGWYLRGNRKSDACSRRVGRYTTYCQRGGETRNAHGRSQDLSMSCSRPCGRSLHGEQPIKKKRGKTIIGWIKEPIHSAIELMVSLSLTAPSSQRPSRISSKILRFSSMGLFLYGEGICYSRSLRDSSLGRWHTNASPFLMSLIAHWYKISKLSEE